MARVIKFLSLQKPELSYEVAIRGEKADGTVEELRKQITKLCRLFPSEDILESSINIKEDIAGVNLSLDKLESFIKTLNTKPDLNVFKRAQNLASHLFHRINRIDASTSPQMLEALEVSIGRYQSLTEELGEFKFADNEPQPQTSQGNYTPTCPIPQINVTCDRGSSNDFSSLRFNGKSCARAFIIRVNEFIKARNISPNKVLSFATEIFTDEALHWFRCIKEQVSSWDQVCERLKDDFTHADYDYRFLSEIRARTQGEKENITIYLSIMAGMFSQLNRELSEEEKLEIILHNIRPAYATVLTSSPDIKDIESLRILCKNYENVQSRLSQFHEPPKITSATLAPDYAYPYHTAPSENVKSYPKPYSGNNKYPNYGQNQRSGYTNYHNKPNFQNNGNNNNYRQTFQGPKPVHTVEKKLFCPRCRVDTHGLRSCKAERKIVCFRCGRPDVKFHDCPDCQNASFRPKN